MAIFWRVVVELSSYSFPIVLTFPVDADYGISGVMCPRIEKPLIFFFTPIDALTPLWFFFFTAIT